MDRKVELHTKFTGEKFVSNRVTQIDDKIVVTNKYGTSLVLMAKQFPFEIVVQIVALIGEEFKET